jgi:uncharacterized protein (TIGR00255 family)
MIRSMTGFGEAERDTSVGRLRVEIKTVNHRYFSANIRVPSALDRYETQLREWIRQGMPRGHVSVSVRIEPANGGGGEPGLRLNEARARQYVRVLQELKDRVGVAGEVDLSLLSRYADLIERDEQERIELDVDDLRQVVEQAVRGTVALREEEGRRLQADLEERLAAIGGALEVIARRAPERLVAERDRLRRSVAELAGDVAVDEDRLAREIAYLADRWDVSEEIVRLRSHMVLFTETLAGAGEEPVGKRLGFLTQEMHREANTIGSKSNDAPIDHQVVIIKNEIERLREQIENVE